jgi:hypothetical protein
MTRCVLVRRDVAPVWSCVSVVQAAATAAANRSSIQSTPRRSTARDSYTTSEGAARGLYPLTDVDGGRPHYAPHTAFRLAIPSSPAVFDLYLYRPPGWAVRALTALVVTVTLAPCT